MSFVAKPVKGEGADDGSGKICRIRITLTSRNVANLEKGECRRATVVSSCHVLLPASARCPPVPQACTASCSQRHFHVPCVVVAACAVVALRCVGGRSTPQK
jgi:hypothetical protein